MQKVLLIDTNLSSEPIYNFLVRSGFEVFVIGANSNDFLAKSVKNYINCDYSDVSRSRDVIDQKKIDHIVPGCNDLSYLVCAALNSEGDYSGLDSMETTDRINNKEQFRKLASRIGLPVPKLISPDNAEDIWPVIVKPVDAYSGRGMTVLERGERNNLKEAILRAREFSRSKTCIIEEYIQGQLYSHSAFISDGTIGCDFIVEEHGTANPFVVDTSRVLYDFPSQMLTHIRECITLLAEKLNMVDGLVHTQFVANSKSLWLIEITRRCPGDLYSQLIELSTGFKYAETYARPFIREKLSIQDAPTKKSWIMRHTVSQPSEGIMGSIQFNIPVQLVRMIPLSVAGDRVKGSPFGRIALIFVQSDSEKDLLAIYRNTLNRTLYKIRETC